MINIPFDQYQRYKLSEIMVNLYKDYYNLSTVKILEVGANEHKNLEKFLPNDYIYYLDINLPTELIEDPKYILGDATNLINIDNNSYDIVIALDVYEHIPNFKRKNFLLELERVSQYGVIISAPFNDSYVEEAEIRANEYFKLLTNQDFIWLKEHIDEKLPCLNETNKIIESMNFNYINFKHGNIYIWEKLIKYHFFVSYFNNISSYRTLVDEFYNKNIFFSDVGEENYRTFITYSNDYNLMDSINSHLNDLFNNNLNTDNESFLNYLIEESKDISNSKNISSICSKNIQDKYEIVCYIKDSINYEFNEDYTIKKYVHSNNIYEIFKLNNYIDITEIRIDPINSNCIIENFEVYSIIEGKRVDLEILYSNSDLEFDKIKFFLTDDPQIYINLKGKDINCITVSYRILEYDSANINNIVKILNDNLMVKNREIEILNDNLMKNSEEIESLNNILLTKSEEVYNLENVLIDNTNTIKRLEEVIESKNKELNDIKNSRSWKMITKIKRIIGK